LGLSAAFASGELQCVVCGRPLNTVGIAAARKSDPGHLVFCCESLDCQEHFHQDG
jgi:hypothetical protein